jgi:tight adherence protein B
VPTWVLVLIVAGIFTAVLSVGQGAYWAWIARQDRHSREVLRRIGIGGMSEAEEAADNLFREMEADAALDYLGGIGLTLQNYIVQADQPITVATLVTRMAIGFGIGLVGGGIILGTKGVVLGPIFGAAPLLLLRYQANSRRAKLVEQLPEALELMSRSLQAGLSLNDAMRMVAEEMELPISSEFGRVFEQIRFGREYRDALSELISRNPGVFDLRLMVSSVLLQRETGGNLIEILENIAGTIRARFIFQGKVRAMTSEARFSAWVLGSLPIFVTTIITLSNPEYLAPLFDDPKGNLMLMYCFTSYGIGIFIMRDMSNVQV